MNSKDIDIKTQRKRSLLSVRSILRRGLCFGSLVAASWSLGCTAPPPAGELDFDRGRNAMAEQRFDLARQHFEQAHVADPGLWQAVRLAGMAWMQGGSQSLVPATENLTLYLQHDPEDTEVRLVLARCYRQLGEFEKAQDVLAELEPTSEVRLMTAELWLDSDAQVALKMIDGFPATDPQLYRALAVVSEARRSLDQKDEAIEAAVESLRLNPLQPSLLYRLSRLFVLQSSIPEAQDILRRLQVVESLQDRNGKTPTERLRLLREHADFLDEANPFVTELRIALQLATGKLAEAHGDIEALEAVRDLPLDVDLTWTSQLLGTRQGEERLQRLYADHGEDRRVANRFVTWLLARGDLDQALAVVTERLQAEPHLGRYHYLLAQVELGRQRRAEALEAMGRALELAPWKADWRRDLVLWHLDHGEIDAAESVWSAAPEAHPLLDALGPRFGRKAGQDEGIANDS